MNETEILEMRKIVPVVARISAGKSQLLNILYNINYLESKEGITTKFINLIRYNPAIEKPRFFHLKLKKEEEKYIFYKDVDYTVIEGGENITKENKKINDKISKLQEFNYEDIFYMTEIKESPFIKDDNYLLSHDLCDVPGLSEAQNIGEETNSIESNINNIESKSKNEINIINEDEGSYFKNMLKDAFGYFFGNNNENENIKNTIINKNEEIEEEDNILNEVKDEKNTYLSEIFKIIREYIDGAIIILNQENYYFKSNYELITKFYKVIKKPLTNFLVILNKIDLSDNPEKDINDCKGFFFKYFSKCKTFNLNLNTFIPLCTFRLKDELLLNKNFKHLLKYHLDNYIMRTAENRFNDNQMSFIEYLEEIIKLKGKNLKKSQIKEVYLENGVIDEIEKTIEEIKEIHSGREINYGLDDFSNDFETDNNKIEPMEIIKYLYKCHSNNELIPLPSENTNNLINYFLSNKPLLKIEKSNINEINTICDEKMDLMIKIIKNIEDIQKILSDNDLINNEIDKTIKEKIIKLYNLGIDNNIFIPFLGPKNVGKSTIINGIIGEEILSTNTRKAFIISYLDDNKDEITISKSKLKARISGDKVKYYFDFKDDYIIAKGFENVRETIRGLNYEISSQRYNNSSQSSFKPEEAFYHIKIKIKLFDDLNFDDNLKKKIYLIDVPNFENSYSLARFISNELLNIFNLFVIVVRNNLIKDPVQRNELEYIFTKSMEQTGTISKGFIKSCLFILNWDKDNESKKNNIDSSIEEIKRIINVENETNINLCHFNAEYFKSYMQNYNFFYNIEETINNLFRAFYNNKNLAFKYPEKYNEKFYKYYDSFENYFVKQLNDKISQKEIFDKKPKSNQIIKEIIKEKIEQAIKNIELPKYGIKIEFTDKNKNIIYKAFTFCQDNLHSSKLLNKSNYDNLESDISNKIIYINNENYNKFIENADTIVKTLDSTLTNDNYETKLNDFQDKIARIKEDMDNFSKEIVEIINKLREDFIANLIDSLRQKKSEIINKIKNKENNDNDLNSELNELLINKYKTFNNNIMDIFNNIASKQNSFYIKMNSKILEYSKNNLEKFKDFKEYFICIVLKKDNHNYDIFDEISKEINVFIRNGISKIWEKKSILEYLKSKFWKDSYFSNIIDIISDYSSEKIKSILDLISNNFKDFINEQNEIIDLRTNLLCLQSTSVNKQKIEEVKHKNDNNLDNLKKLRELCDKKNNL